MAVRRRAPRARRRHPDRSSLRSARSPHPRQSPLSRRDHREAVRPLRAPPKDRARRLGRLELRRATSITRVRTSPVRPLVVMVAALLPTAVLAWYLSDPARNQPIIVRLEHFVITSNVSIVAAVVAFLVARAALGVGHYRALLIALGFACIAAIFAVHGLSTPGVLQQGDRQAPAQVVPGVSAEPGLAG